jgi:hypothetical protein
MAHVFHNWKRARIGLRETRHREFLLNIDFTKREIFAFACEAYSRILELGRSPAVRRQLLARFSLESAIAGKGKERAELLQVLEAAVGKRNGWKQILTMCSDGRGKRRATVIPKT